MHSRFLAPEMMALSAAEMLLTFSLALIVLTPDSRQIGIEAISPAILCALTVVFVAFIIGVYRPKIFERIRPLLFNTMLSAILSFPVIWILTKISGLDRYWPVGYDSLRPLKVVALWSAGVLAIRLTFYLATRLKLFVHRVAFVSAIDNLDAPLAPRISREGFLEIVTVRPQRASASRLNARGITTLVFPRGPDGRVVPAIDDEYRRHGITVLNQLEFWEDYLRRIDLDGIDDAWLRQLTHVVSNRRDAHATRAFDISASLLLLCATLPIIGLIALVVKLDSSGPVLYRQERLGLGSRPFTLLKFRSMRPDAEVTGPSWAQQRDPRVTRVGLFMRKTRIDELPQLLNILRGEMSFIGPRPERPHFVEQLRKVIPSYSERACVKPGLTGWAQVNYPYGASVEDARAKLSYDLYYVKNRSLWLDLLILLSTVRVILLQEGSR